LKNSAQTDRLKRERYFSVDALRGFAIALMFLVSRSNPIPQLRHSGWIGVTLADIVYPLFLFAIGISMHLSTSSQDARGIESSRQARRFFFRVLRLFFLGLLLYSVSYKTFRVTLGTLQCIAIASLAAYPLVRSSPRERLIGVGLILGVVLALTLWGLPEIPRAQKWTEHFTFSERLDFAILGERRGPEGLLSTFAATANIVFGLVAGRILQTTTAFADRERAVLSFAAACGACAFILVFLGLPISMPLFSASYVMLLAAISFFILALLIPLDYFPDFAGLARPLVIYGANPIAAYVFVKLFQTFFLNQLRLPIAGAPLFGEWLAAATAGFGVPIVKVLVGWLFCYLLWRGKIFLRL